MNHGGFALFYKLFYWRHSSVNKGWSDGLKYNDKDAMRTLKSLLVGIGAKCAPANRFIW